MSKERTNIEKLFDLIKKPVITEKSVGASSLNKYTFEVDCTGCRISFSGQKS